MIEDHYVTTRIDTHVDTGRGVRGDEQPSKGLELLKRAAAYCGSFLVGGPVLVDSWDVSWLLVEDAEESINRFFPRG